MYQLNVELRDPKEKAKKLRREGLVTGNIFGGKLEKTMLIQMPEGIAKKLLREKFVGGMVVLTCEGKKYPVLLKEVSNCPVTYNIEELSFQSLAEGVTVLSQAQVVLLNRNEVPFMVSQILSEIHYKALPEDLVEVVEIDVTQMKEEQRLTLEELPIWNDKTIEIVLPGDSVVCISEIKKALEVDSETDAEVEAAPVAAPAAATV